MIKTLFLALLLIPFLSNAQIQPEELYEACTSGEYDIVKQYIKDLQDINIHFDNGETPLMTACRNNHPEIIELLVSSGADLNMVNPDGMTAMTLLRLQMGFNDTFHSEDQKNLRKMYKYLRSKGGIEQDYVKLIAENKSGEYKQQQAVVLQIKDEFGKYMSDADKFKTKKYTQHKHEGDDYTYTDNKNSYLAIYDDKEQLVFFQHKYDHHAEWHDNGMKEGSEKHYYFKNNTLYFYFETSYYGPFDLTYTQRRYYFNKNQIILAAVKSYDEWWETMKDEPDRFSFKNLVNIKDIESYLVLDKKSKAVLNNFNSEYHKVKHLLK